MIASDDSLPAAAAAALEAAAAAAAESKCCRMPGVKPSRVGGTRGASMPGGEGLPIKPPRCGSCKRIERKSSWLPMSFDMRYVPLNKIRLI